ncbi:hypothetical protein E2C01_040902 [Portunus trituberculatus]|uniref:Uncharacterized protein n=1 Tax=Portunus trituberculatus TaxID=210409 RepID=A0A5B7FNY8_PORTR|nr:hypothetical protein [Portunus trituberculatus]
MTGRRPHRLHIPFNDPSFSPIPPPFPPSPLCHRKTVCLFSIDVPNFHELQLEPKISGQNSLSCEIQTAAGHHRTAPRRAC